MARKYEAIDLMKLYTLGSANGWNEFLQACLDKKSINHLAKMRYQIQAGMDDLAKQKLNTDEINIWFVRLNKSIEDTAKKIIRMKHPLPQDSGAKNLDADLHKWQEAKRKRDLELKKFLKDSSY